ncbi:sulfurtransferase complex subunit TusC [Haliea sp. E17]|uniref:sulfurtransferase complex subunit TusC n=1 Tax=Haliea sp. E17 TaxID=3401576 RepID=UPI003AAEFB7C
MTEITRHKQLVVLRQPPYASTLSRSAIDLALAMGAFEQDVQLLFLGDGVLQLLQDQHAEAIGQKSAGKILSSLPLYDVESVYVDAAAIARYGLQADQLVVPVELLDAADIRSIMTQCDHLLSL